MRHSSGEQELFTAVFARRRNMKTITVFWTVRKLSLNPPFCATNFSKSFKRGRTEQTGPICTSWSAGLQGYSQLLLLLSPWSKVETFAGEMHRLACLRFLQGALTSCGRHIFSLLTFLWGRLGSEVTAGHRHRSETSLFRGNLSSDLSDPMSVLYPLHQAAFLLSHPVILLFYFFTLSRVLFCLLLEHQNLPKSG